MRKFNIKRLLLAAIFIISLAFSFSSCKPQHHCPAYSKANTINQSQNS